jgi:hypothetical protein
MRDLALLQAFLIRMVPCLLAFSILWAGISKEILVPDRRGVGVFKATTTEYLAVVSALCLESVLVLDCGLVEAGLPASLGQHLFQPIARARRVSC